MSVIAFPSVAQAPRLLKCSSCGIEVDAGCNCGAPYVPAGERAVAAIAANPEKSTRAIADATGLSEPTVRRARKSTASCDAVEKRIGKDGRVRRLPTKKVVADDPAISGEAMKQARAAAEAQTNDQADDQDHGFRRYTYSAAGARARDEGHRTGQAAVNPIVAAWDSATEELRAAFEKHIAGLQKHAKALTAVLDPNKNLNAAKIGAYLELIGPDCFLEAVRHAPKLWAEVERRGVAKALATKEYAQSKLLKNGNAGARP
jgi:hypothetical protein